MVSFAVQKVLSLIHSHLFIFVFILITLGGVSKRFYIYRKSHFEWATFPVNSMANDSHIRKLETLNIRVFQKR